MLPTTDVGANEGSNEGSKPVRAIGVSNFRLAELQAIFPL